MESITLIYRGVKYIKNKFNFRINHEKEKKIIYRGVFFVKKEIYIEDLYQIKIDLKASDKKQKNISASRNSETKRKLVLDQDISKIKKIGSGGEGEVWTTDWKSHLAKIYYQEILENTQKKLELMVQNKPKDLNYHQNHISCAWPEYLLENTQGQVIGFLMPIIESAKHLIDIYNPKLRKKLNLNLDWQVDWEFLHIVAKNIASIIQTLHSQNYVLGDIQPQNILINKKGLPSIIDTDSFQVSDPHTGELYPSLVGLEGFTPPELIGQDLANNSQEITHDNFRLAVVIYHLLFGEHPFKGRWKGSGDPLEIDDLVRQGFWCHASHSPISSGDRTIPLEIVHPKVKEYFLRCFNQGHDNSQKRPTAKDWVDVLQIAINDLVQCEKVKTHRYSKTYSKCYWCQREKKLGRDIFPDIKIDYYDNLIDLLKSGKWKEADLETKYIMLKISRRTNQGWLDEPSIRNFPIEELDTIDQLWLQYSSEHFGFSVQKTIYEAVCNQVGAFNIECYKCFGETIGWREEGVWKNYLDLEFSLQAPKGHLPFCSAGFDVFLVSLISQKLAN